jgi:hypothetical protein
MTKLIGQAIAHFSWSLMVGGVWWFAFKINGTVVGYFSIVVMINAAYLLAAPIVAAISKE